MGRSLGNQRPRLIEWWPVFNSLIFFDDFKESTAIKHTVIRFGSMALKLCSSYYSYSFLNKYFYLTIKPPTTFDILWFSSFVSDYQLVLCIVVRTTNVLCNSNPFTVIASNNGMAVLLMGRMCIKWVIMELSFIPSAASLWLVNRIPRATRQTLSGLINFIYYKALNRIQWCGSTLQPRL